VASIHVERVSKVFPGGPRALDDVSLTINDGEFMVLVGPSGCGKSTLLRSLAGLEDIDGGRIWLGEVDVTDQGPQDRDMAMVFQNYALYPHKTVYENLEFGLRMRKVPAADRAARVSEVAKTLGLDTLLDRKPQALSGGQRQRVAMGRAIVRQPQAFLMDEPLSNLDAKLRVTMRAELSKLHQRFQVTTVYVTHDQVEAMTLGTRVAVMRDGVIQQCDAPKALFDHPSNLFVAAFIGSPSMNLVSGLCSPGQVRAAEWVLPVKLQHSGEAIVGIRPTDFSLSDQAPADWPRVEITVLTVEELGAETIVTFQLDAPRVNIDAVEAAREGSEAEGDTRLFADDNRVQFAARIDGHVAVRPGDSLTLAIDVRRLHLFDPASGANVSSTHAAGM
jgi:multiple sugar transport system ATP-binding protein